MSSEPLRMATMEIDGWTLVSAEERHEQHPDAFMIPSRDERENLKSGDAAKLLFDIETREGGRIIDRGVDRMWVIVKRRVDGNYVGVLGSDPGTADGLRLHPGMELLFGPEHVAEIGHPPRSYVVETCGMDGFEE
jgi:hypothetical protein